jgi:hypothetical protein
MVVVTFSCFSLQPSFALFLACFVFGQRVDEERGRGCNSNSIIRLFPRPLCQERGNCNGMNSLMMIIRTKGIHVGDDDVG